MSKNKVEINQKDLKALQKRFDSLEKFDKYLDKELSVTVKESENSAAMAFTANWGNPTGQGRASINSGKNKRLSHYVRAEKSYMPFLEWGTRRLFNPSNLRFLDDLGIPRSYAKQFMATPLKKETNIPARPYFFPALKKAIKNLNKRIEKRLKQITK